MDIKGDILASPEKQVWDPFSNDDIEWHRWDFLNQDINEREPEDMNYQIEMALTLASKDDLIDLIDSVFEDNDNYAKSFEQLHIKKERA